MEINIYTIPECPFCIKLKGLLDDADMTYSEHNIYDDEHESTFEKFMELSGSDSVPMITVGKHLLAPDINFNSIEQAFELIQYIEKNENE